MECDLCRKVIFNNINDHLCTTCFNQWRNSNIRMGARYQAQGHSLKCSLSMIKGKRCNCGKTKYYNGFISKMIKKVNSNITCNFNTL